MKFSELLNIAKRKWFLFILFPLVFGGLATLFSYTFIPNEYTSSTSIYFVRKLEVIDKTDNSTTYYPDWGLSGAVITDVLTLIKSQKASEAIMSDMGISSLDGFTINVASTEKNSRIVNIIVTGKDNEEVARLANCTAAEIAKLISDQMYVDQICNVLEEAKPATSPSGPNRKIFILGAAGVGFCISLIIAFLSFIMDTTIKTASDLKEIDGLNILAQVPYIKKPGRA